MSRQYLLSVVSNAHPGQISNTSPTIAVHWRASSYTAESLHANSAAGDGSYVSTLSLLDSLLDHNVVTVTEQAWAASSSVLIPMYYRDRAATKAYYDRLYAKCRNLDSKLQLDFSRDLASQPAWVQYCKECTNLVVLRAMFVNGEPSRKIDIGQFARICVLHGMTALLSP